MAPRKGRSPRSEVERDYPASTTFAELKVGSPSTTVFQVSDNSRPPTLTLRSRGNPKVEIHNTCGRPPDENTFDAIESDLKTLCIHPDQQTDESKAE